MLSTCPPVNSAVAFVLCGLRIRVGIQASPWLLAYLFTPLSFFANSLHILLSELIHWSDDQGVLVSMGMCQYKARYKNMKCLDAMLEIEVNLIPRNHHILSLHLHKHSKKVRLKLKVCLPTPNSRLRFCVFLPQRSSLEVDLPSSN